MQTYPINLIGLADRKTVVVGGGAVALRKIEGLLEGGAQITVISPALADGLAALHAAGKITLIQRSYQDGDLAGAWLAIAATDNVAANHAVFAEADRRGCLINVVDDPEHSNFIVPAVVRRGEVTVAVSTGGGSPALARRLRERLAALIGPEYGDLAALLAELRPELLARFPAGQPRLQAALRLVDSDLLPVLRQEGRAAARNRALALLADQALPQGAGSQLAPGVFSPGVVYLIGAGPGDPGLITARGLACLRAADVVVYDRLVAPALLAEAPCARQIDVGKKPGNHPVPQEEINAILVEQAQHGGIVVRLKGGDPFVFGRGGEEAEALAEAGIPFEIVPGVTSAIAAAAYAGIPITYRDAACSFTVLTGHRKDEASDPGCDWQRAAGADTLVFLMGVGNLPLIVRNLLDAGRAAETPAAIVARGTWPQQRTVTGTLQDIAARAEAAGLQPPAALIVGEVVRLRERLRWFDRPERRPLLGLRVLNTRPAHEAAEFSGQLANLGADVISLPAIAIATPGDTPAFDDVIHLLAAGAADGPAYDWIIFTSANAARAFLDRVLGLRPVIAGSAHYDMRSLAGARLAAIGPATATALRGYGLVADLVAEGGTGKHLAQALPNPAGQRVLLPRSDQALQDLSAALAARGAQVTEVIAYLTKPAEPTPQAWRALEKGVDVATFFSPSALRGLADMAAAATGRPAAAALLETLRGAAIACIGPTTAAAAQALGLHAAIMPDAPSAAGLLDALVKWRQETAPQVE